MFEFGEYFVRLWTITEFTVTTVTVGGDKHCNVTLSTTHKKSKLYRCIYGERLFLGILVKLTSYSKNKSQCKDSPICYFPVVS